jgi:amino acid transporter
MVHADAWVDPAQLALTGAHFSGFQGGIVLAFMLMGGFEGATSLGEEAQDPKKSIPRAIFSCMLPLTLLYMFMAYCIVSLKNRGIIGAQIDGLTVPFDNVARAIRLPWLGPASSLGVALSYFACGLGSLTVAARVLFSMAREGRFWSRFGAAHPRNATPYRAIALISMISIAIPAGMLASGAELSFSINFLSQLGSFGLIGGYALVVVALPLYLRRLGLLKAGDVAVAGAATLSLAVVLVLSVYPVPPPPYNLVVYVFAGCTLAGTLASVLVRRGLPERSRTSA